MRLWRPTSSAAATPGRGDLGRDPRKGCPVSSIRCGGLWFYGPMTENELRLFERGVRSHAGANATAAWACRGTCLTMARREPWPLFV